MKKNLVTLMLILMIAGLQAQVAPNKFYVQFTDKNDSPYSLDNPEEFLTARAIERRINQNIPLEYSDLPVNPAYLEGVAAAGATILNPAKWFNGVTIFTTSQSVLVAIESLPYVASVSKSGNPLPDEGHDKFLVEKSFFKNEIYNQPVVQNSIPTKGSAEFNYGPSYNQIQMLKGADFHEMGYRGQGKVIAVLDAGFLNANTLSVFDSLWQNDQILGTRDFVKGGPVTFDDHSHGSMVLSCMGGNFPGELIGTAPKASYWLLRSEDGGTEYIIEEYNWISAAEYADSVGADVINSSLGYTTFNNPSQDHSYADMDGNTTPITRGADMAARKGILVVNSLGNEGSSDWYYLGAPSDGDSVMGIGAVTSSGNPTTFTSHGPSYDGRVKPDVVAQGSNVYIINPDNGNFGYGSGTSFSSPILAGMAACLWQANPELNNMQIAQAIRQSGSQYLFPDDLKGYGIPDFIQAHNILTVVEGLETESFVIHIYPNPFTSDIRLGFSGQAGGAGEVVISDIAGRTLLSRTIDPRVEKNLILSLPQDTPAGIYFLKFISGYQAVSSKLVKF